MDTWLSAVDAIAGEDSAARKHLVELIGGTDILASYCTTATDLCDDGHLHRSADVYVVTTDRLLIAQVDDSYRLHAPAARTDVAVDCQILPLRRIGSVNVQTWTTEDEGQIILVTLHHDAGPATVDLEPAICDNEECQGRPCVISGQVFTPTVSVRASGDDTARLRVFASRVTSAIAGA